MAFRRADAARDTFHGAEDVEREAHGNHRPGKDADEPEDAQSTG